MSELLDSKVIVVDDMVSLRESIIICLKRIGFTSIAQAADGVEALKKIEDANDAGEPFEMIFSDINMPNKNGIELINDVRMIEAYTNTPIIIISSENEKEIVMDAILAGANNYILKPFTPATIKAKLQEQFPDAGII